jgi:hypothetical protein
MKKIALSSVLFFFIITTIAQPGINWKKCYGGKWTEYIYDMKRTEDKGLIIIGTTSGGADADVTNYIGSEDIWVVKLDSAGNIQWQQSYGDSSNDDPVAIQIAPDGRGYTFMATTGSSHGQITYNHGGWDVWVVAIDYTGNIIWQKTYGGSAGEMAEYMSPTKDSGYIFIATTNSSDGDITNVKGGPDIWVVKINKYGTIQWQKNYGGTGIDNGAYIEQTTDGGYIATGLSGSTNGDLTNNYGGNDIWAFKLNAIGTIVWQKNYGGSSAEGGEIVHQTSDGGYILYGHSYSNDYDAVGLHPSSFTPPQTASDALVLKLDANGSVIWKKMLGGSYNDQISDIIQLKNGGYVFEGTTNSNDGDVSGYHPSSASPPPVQPTYDIWLAALSSTGNLDWQKCIGSSETDFGACIVADNDSNFTIGGSVRANDCDLVNSGFHAFSGNTGNPDIMLMKLGLTTGITKVIGNKNIKVFPNPVSNSLNIELPAGYENAEISLSNILGQAVEGYTMTPARGLMRTIVLDNIPQGHLLLQVINKEEHSIYKIIKQ